MDDQILTVYSKITGGIIPDSYDGPEEQGKQIVKCSLLKETCLEYSNSTDLKPSTTK